MQSLSPLTGLRELYLGPWLPVLPDCIAHLPQLSRLRFNFAARDRDRSRDWPLTLPSGVDSVGEQPWRPLCASPP